MQAYFPFLKMKQNEIGAIAGLGKEFKATVIPFFDIPRPKNSSESEILHRAETSLKGAHANLKDVNFFLDNYDLDDEILLSGEPQYKYLLNMFAGFNVIPVAALNREDSHNSCAIEFSKSHNKKIALRLTKQDVESFKLIFSDLDFLMKSIYGAGLETYLVIDLRVINQDPLTLSKMIEGFLLEFHKNYSVKKIIIAGSTIPPSVRDLLKTKTVVTVKRAEWEVWKSFWVVLPSEVKCDYAFGDYGVVSPEYTDVELEFSMLQNVAAPKVFYTVEDKFFIIRGGAFKTHPNGYRQYFMMADYLHDQKLLRPITYSSGEKYIHDRCSHAPKKPSKAGSPGSWLKATLNSHMTFVLRNL